MKIMNVALRTERFPLKKPFVFAKGRIYALTQVFAVVRTENRVGKGQATLSPLWADNRGLDPEDVEREMLELAESFASAIEGLSGIPTEIYMEGIRKIADRTLPTLTVLNAISAIDMAVWDAWGLFNGVPAWQTTIPTISTTEKTEHAAKIAANAKGAKIKLHGSPEGDAKFLTQLPRSKRYILDGNESYTPKTLRNLLEILPTKTRIEYIEQPYPRYRKWRVRGLGVKVFADELIATHKDIRIARELGYAGIVVKPSAKTITESLLSAKLARALGLAVAVGDLTTCPPIGLDRYLRCATILRPDVELVESNWSQYVRPPNEYI